MKKKVILMRWEGGGESESQIKVKVIGKDIIIITITVGLVLTHVEEL